LPIVRQWFVTKRTERQLLPAAQALWDFFEKRSAEYLPDAAGQLAGEAGKRPALTPIPAT
jgi:LysR family transcriptional regulator for metE and metH